MMEDRISWVRRQVQAGIHVRVNTGPANDIHKFKVEILIEPWKAALPWASQQLLLGMLAMIETVGKTYVCVDRGHRHSNGGSEIALWLHQPGESYAKHGGTPSSGAVDPARATPGKTGECAAGNAAAEDEQEGTYSRKEAEEKKKQNDEGNAKQKPQGATWRR